MPLSAVIPVLSAGFLTLFEAPPPTQAAAANVWATAYVNYCLAGGATPTPIQQQTLANTLQGAFNPDAPAGAAGLVGALTAFWPGTLVPGMGPGANAVVFIPAGDLSLIPPGVAEAKSKQCADALAQIVHTLTVASVKVVIPPSPAQVPIL